MSKDGESTKTAKTAEDQSLSHNAVTADGERVADDWESIATDEVQQLTDERLTMVQQQQKSTAAEQLFLNEHPAESSASAVPSAINKPFKLLKREQPIRARSNDSETALSEEKLLEKLSLEERKANYDKIRERIFADSESASKAVVEEKPQTSAAAVEPVKVEDPSEEISVEPINHLSDVQMLTEQLPAYFNIFVGGLGPEIDHQTLGDAFAPFGEVFHAKVIRDPQTMQSKGYGFVSFSKRENAERAIVQMNGKTLGQRTLRTNWATRKAMNPPPMTIPPPPLYYVPILPPPNFM